MRTAMFLALTFVLLACAPATAFGGATQRFEIDMAGEAEATHLEAGDPPGGGGCEREDAPFRGEWAAAAYFGASFVIDIHFGPRASLDVKDAELYESPVGGAGVFGMRGYQFEGDPLCTNVRWPAAGTAWGECLGSIVPNGNPHLNAYKEGRKLFFVLEAWRQTELQGSCSDELGRSISPRSAGIEEVLGQGLGGLAFRLPTLKLRALSTNKTKLVFDRHYPRPSGLLRSCEPILGPGECTNQDWLMEQKAYVTLIHGTLDGTFGPPHRKIPLPKPSLPDPSPASFG
jgi:hypothetical protein